MKKNQKYIICKALFMLIATSLFFYGCKKDEYYLDGGIANANFEGSTLDYLNSKPFNFDTIATIVKLAGMEKEFTNGNITFFAPQDYGVRRLFVSVNAVLFANGKDTLRSISDVNGTIWKKYLSNYIYKGVNVLKDYPQVDLGAKAIFPGQNYTALNGEIFNVGVVYATVGGVKYAGYRQLCISAIPNSAQPFDNWNTAFVTSSDIRPRNSSVHVLSTQHIFGFDPVNFAQDVLLSK